MLTDVALAILHHFLIFLMAGLLAAELALIRTGLEGCHLPMLGKIDAAYGGVAMAVVIVGVSRVIYGLKGWEYYVYYWAFWAKMMAFLAVGLLSTLPTARITKWRRATATDSGFSVTAAEISAVRSYLWAEVAVFALIPLFAAMMARAIGY